MRQTLRLSVFLLFAIMGSTGPQARAQSAVVPPNIVLLVIDDVRWDAVGVSGNRFVRTPRIDAIAKDGVWFDQARVTTSICMVSRASLLTGQYMSRHGIAAFGRAIPPAAFADTFPARLRGAGYWTGYVGKYGVGPPRPEDFDFLRAYEGMHWLTDASGDRIHVTEKNARDTLDFLRARPKDKPFSLTVGFFAAHAEDECAGAVPAAGLERGPLRRGDHSSPSARRPEVPGGVAAVSLERSQRRTSALPLALRHVRELSGVHGPLLPAHHGGRRRHWPRRG